VILVDINKSSGSPSLATSFIKEAISKIMKSCFRVYLWVYDKNALVKIFIIAYENATTRTPMIALVRADFPLDILEGLKILLAYKYPA
jgi:hypothetical protein